MSDETDQGVQSAGRPQPPGIVRVNEATKELLAGKFAEYEANMRVVWTAVSDPDWGGVYVYSPTLGAFTRQPEPGLAPVPESTAPEKP